MQKKTEFKLPYIGFQHELNFDVVYTAKGDFSVIIECQNPILQYSADASSYYDFHSLYDNIIKILGAGYILQKQDVLVKQAYEGKTSDDFLTQKYFENFNGRKYTAVYTYLIITRSVKKSRFFTHDDKSYNAFKTNISKVVDLLDSRKLNPVLYFEKQIQQHIKKVLAMKFDKGQITLNNLKATDDHILLGEDMIRSISLVDIDELNIPSKVAPYVDHPDLKVRNGFPVDTMAFMLQIPSYEVIIYNQVIVIPDQRSTVVEMELKKKRHSSVPDPANDHSVDDITKMLEDVARENQLMVYAHYNILVRAHKNEMSKVSNFIEGKLFDNGITASKNAYNQLELFRTVLPGNTVELKSYDLLLTTADAGLCFFFKERLLSDEKSDFQIYFSDRQGIPVAIDTCDLPMSTNRITNYNQFVLGPSGTGKSFFMNHMVRQYKNYNMDVILVDTGNSYSGLCALYDGRYITYTEEKPITMNPFRMLPSEYNIEKKDFLKTLLSLLWKGTEGTVSPIEDTVLSNLIGAYYEEAFSKGFARKDLSFNTFYEFALKFIPQHMKEEEIPFEYNEFRFVLKKYYKGGQYAAILNDEVDNSLFEEGFIVFEIDSIKENKTLFPIVTIIIMDIFLQKMRFKSNRKALIIEEAWKAIASPMMASYLIYVYKTVRKFLGSAVVVTQQLSDIIGNAVVKDSILINSDTVCLLDQTKFKDNFAEIAMLLGLTEIEQKKIFTIGKLDNKDGRGRFKEVYIRRGPTGEVYGIENSIYEYLVFTTERPEKEALLSYVLKYHGNFEIGLEAFVEDFKASKLTLLNFVTKVNKNRLTQPAIELVA